MMNFRLSDFLLAFLGLRQAKDYYYSRAAEEGAHISNQDKNMLSTILADANLQCSSLGLKSAEYRFARMYCDLETLVSGVDHAWVVRELGTLIEAIEDDCRTEKFYHYPTDRRLALDRIQGEWNAAIRAFPSAKLEIERGVDCYALQHDTASVFHMMRVAEIGMRSLARERKVVFPKHPLEWAEWNDMIDEIERRARLATQGMRRGEALDAARSFYTSAVAQLRAFKETRNKISHMRGEFDGLDAQRAMSQVRDFMNGLASKLSEATRRPISKWP